MVVPVPASRMSCMAAAVFSSDGTGYRLRSVDAPAKEAVERGRGPHDPWQGPCVVDAPGMEAVEQWLVIDAPEMGAVGLGRGRGSHTWRQEPCAVDAPGVEAVERGRG